MSTREIVELIAALTMPCGIIGLVINRWVNAAKLKSRGGIGARSIQFASVCMLFPTIVILALERAIEGQTSAALLGGAVGYLLSGISNYDLSRLVEKMKPTDTNDDGD
ncbi:hypothetical protein [Rhizomicrobium electricum]|uniref:Holin n=1 Tax=Rhizomicrobium electricum TaxID=480070 RepID=A0ABN1E6K8_9PROT|nr:hypothetical protein [Rhizomicrobium electricum]NIJ47790.1 hypothetical protein [Rhizomicrobium electricum]